MNVLPVIERELRVAARRKSTYRLRWWTALAGMAICFASFLVVSLQFSSGGAGSTLFSIFTGYAFGLCCLAGVFLASDALSSEKREGTLGLLFLSGLRGYEIVLGKLVASSLPACYGLMALLPVAAIPILLGGVTPGEFWRVALALLNALLFSINAGLCVSACVRDSGRAMVNTVGLMILFAGLLPGLPEVLAAVGSVSRWVGTLAWASPFTPFHAAGEASYLLEPRRFWGALVVSNLTGWGLLGLGGVALSALWQDRTAEGRSRWRGRTASPARKFRRDLLELSPVAAMIGDPVAVRRAAWLVVVAFGLVAIGLSFTSSRDAYVLSYAVRPFGFILKLLLASEVCRFFAEGRRNGTLELLLCTPLQTADVFRGQSLALKRVFFWPFVLILVFNLIPVGLAPLVALLKSGTTPIESALLGGGFGAIALGYYAAKLVADVFAVVWFGRFLSLKSRNPALAFPLTVLFVLLLPAFAFCIPDVVVDLVLILVGSTIRQRDLRQLLEPANTQRQGL